MNAELTDSQTRTLAFIRTRIARGLPPTLQEIATGLGFTSKNAAHCAVRLLVRKGHLLRDPKSARGLRLPDDVPLVLTREQADVLEQLLVVRDDALGALASFSGHPSTAHASRVLGDVLDALRRQPRRQP